MNSPRMGGKVLNNQTYFYQFLEPISKELAFFARELETSIFTGPRTMLTHARIFVENILQQVMQAEKLPDQQWTSLKERIDLLNQKGISLLKSVMRFIMFDKLGTKPHMIQDRSVILKHYCHGNQSI